jgi:hypothetical protein
MVTELANGPADLDGVIVPSVLLKQKVKAPAGA